MDRNRHYPRCTIVGEGEFLGSFLRKEGKFQIVDMSASGIRVRSNQAFEVGTNKYMRIRLNGYVFEVIINVNGQIVRKNDIGDGFEYGFRFEGLNHKERVEIDELMRNSCGIKYVAGAKFCEDWDCMFINSRAGA
ncbi:MAG: PilZ domain-containing protein [Clostridia bacterium]|nr:PilZ domain-containing protein [Clostridia bacterium]